MSTLKKKNTQKWLNWTLNNGYYMENIMFFLTIMKITIFLLHIAIAVQQSKASMNLENNEVIDFFSKINPGVVVLNLFRDIYKNPKAWAIFM